MSVAVYTSSPWTQQVTPLKKCHSRNDTRRQAVQETVCTQAQPHIFTQLLCFWADICRNKLAWWPHPSNHYLLLSQYLSSSQLTLLRHQKGDIPWFKRKSLIPNSIYPWLLYQSRCIVCAVNLYKLVNFHLSTAIVPTQADRVKLP